MPKDMQVIEETGGHHEGGKKKHSRAPAGPHEARPHLLETGHFPWAMGRSPRSLSTGTIS